MAADFTVPRVRFLNSVLVMVVCLCGCHSSDKRIWHNAADTNFTQVNGLMYRDKKTYTGSTYLLYPGSKDTAAIAGYRRGKEDGIWKNFYPNHVPKQIREFKNGKKTGVFTAWWENKNRKLQYFFEEDEYEGTCKAWNMEGKLIRAMHYVKGHESGRQQMFYDNGKIRANYTIIAGRRYGLLGTKNCVNVPDSVFTH